MFASITKSGAVCASACILSLNAYADKATQLPPTIYPSEITQTSSGYDTMSFIPMVASAAAGSATIFAANALTGGALLAPMIGAQSSAFYGGNLIGSQAATFVAPLVEYSGVVTNSLVSGALYAGSFLAVSANFGAETNKGEN